MKFGLLAVRADDDAPPQSGHCGSQTRWSALPPIADMCGAKRDVRFVPKVEVHSRSVAPTLPIGLRSSGRIRERKFSELELLN